MYRKIVVLTFIVSAGLLFGCSEEEKKTAAPPTRLQLKLTDNAGNLLPGVEVQLYATLEDWTTEQNPVQTATTTSNGVASFIYLTDSEYYVNAASENLSNWEGINRITGIQQNLSNNFELSLRPYPSKFLSSAQGKAWQVVRYKENGVELIDDTTKTCITDNGWRFFKGPTQGNFQLNEGATKCNPADDQIRSSTWHLTGGTLLFTQNQQTESYEIEYLSETTLRIKRQAGGITYAYTLQSN